MYRYAQLNNSGKVVGVAELSGRVEDKNLVEIEKNFNPWGKKFDKAKNSWIDIPAEETTTVQAPTMDEKIEEIKDTQAAIMMAIVDLFEGGVI